MAVPVLTASISLPRFLYRVSGVFKPCDQVSQTALSCLEV